MTFLTALGFLTTIPLPRGCAASPDQMARSVPFFPLAGAVLGLSLVAVDLILSLVLPAPVVNVALIVTEVLLTGALHLDGFIDTCDALGVSGIAGGRLEVMRDSRVGSMGVVGAVCLLLAKYASLASLPPFSRTAALMVMPVLGRWAMVGSISWFPNARSNGLGWMFKRHADRRSLLLATFTAAVVSVGIFHSAGAVLLLGVGCAALGFSTFLSHKFHGLTGDTYGAVGEVTEVAALLLISLLLHAGSQGTRTLC